MKSATEVSSVSCASSRPSHPSAITGQTCPVCRKPFELDEEVGPVPTCECGTRGKVDPWEEGEMPYDDGETEGEE